MKRLTPRGNRAAIVAEHMREHPWRTRQQAEQSVRAAERHLIEVLGPRWWEPKETR